MRMTQRGISRKRVVIEIINMKINYSDNEVVL